MTRWRALFSFFLVVRVISRLALLASSQALATDTSVAVIYPEAQESAYRVVFQSVLQGIRNRLGSNRIQVHPLEEGKPKSGQLRDWLARQTTAGAVITLGKEAYEDYQASGITLPAVSGLLDLSPHLNPTANGISLSVDPALLFETLKRVLPGTRRVSVVYNPAKDQWLIDLARKAAPRYQLEFVAYEASDLASGTQRYLDLLKRIENGRDALWLPLDSKLLEEETVLPLIIENSWHRRFAVFSNSLAHARLGALFALYPDNEALGRHLAEKALERIENPRRSNPTIEPLRDVKRAIHRRFAEHLGVDLGGPLRAYFDTVFGPHGD
ncbi:MAG: ABC transporter substrate-binding protein [Gammaproteobacteria bacterium]